MSPTRRARHRRAARSVCLARPGRSGRSPPMPCNRTGIMAEMPGGVEPDGARNPRGHGTCNVLGSGCSGEQQDATHPSIIHRRASRASAAREQRRSVVDGAARGGPGTAASRRAGHQASDERPNWQARSIARDLPPLIRRRARRGSRFHNLENPGRVIAPHGVAVDAQGNLLVAELSTYGRVHKFELRD